MAIFSFTTKYGGPGVYIRSDTVENKHLLEAFVFFFRVNLWDERKREENEKEVKSQG